MEQQSEAVSIQTKSVQSDVETNVATATVVSRNHNQYPRRIRIEKLRKKRSQLIATKNRLSATSVHNNYPKSSSTTNIPTTQQQDVVSNEHEMTCQNEEEVEDTIEATTEINNDKIEYSNKKMSVIDCGCVRNLTDVLPPEEYELLLKEDENNETMTNDTTPKNPLPLVKNVRKSSDSNIQTDDECCEFKEQRSRSKSSKNSIVDTPVTGKSIQPQNVAVTKRKSTLIPPSDIDGMSNSNLCKEPELESSRSTTAPPVTDVFISMSEWMKENFQSKSVSTTTSLDDMMTSCRSCYCYCCHYTYNEEQPEHNPSRCCNKTDGTTSSVKTSNTSKTCSTSVTTSSSQRCAAAPKVIHEPLIFQAPCNNNRQRNHRKNQIIPDRSLTDDLDDDIEEHGEGRNPKSDTEVMSDISSYPEHDSDDDVIVSGILPAGVPYQISRILIEGWLYKKGTGTDWLHSRSWKVRYGKLCLAYIYSDEYRNGSLEVPLLCIYWYETSSTPTTVIVLDSTVVLSSNHPSKNKVDKKSNLTPDTTTHGEKATTVSSTITTKQIATNNNMTDNATADSSSTVVPSKKPLDEKYLFEIRHATVKQNSTLPVTRIFATATTHSRNEWVYRISDALLSYNKDKASRTRRNPQRFFFSTILSGCNDTVAKSEETEKQLTVIDPVRVITSRPRGSSPRKVPHALPATVSPSRRPPTSPVRSRSPSPPASSARASLHVISSAPSEKSPRTPTTTKPLPFFCDYEVWPRSGLSY